MDALVARGTERALLSARKLEANVEALVAKGVEKVSPRRKRRSRVGREAEEAKLDLPQNPQQGLMW